jgi:hypothetical protein
VAHKLDTLRPFDQDGDGHWSLPEIRAYDNRR